MNRGALLITITSILIIILISLKLIKLKNILILIMLLIILAFIFGNLGDVRLKSEDYFASISQPSEEFEQYNIPKLYLWSYIYITSPLGNLQLTINQREGKSLSGFIASCMIPDFIAKHLKINSNSIEQIAPFLNVGGVYAKAYANMGWLGMIIMFIFIILFIFNYILFLPRNTPYTITGLAIISALVIFNFFDNMVVFSGFFIPLTYPMLLGLIYKWSVPK
jgi:hypothetical protein